MAAKIEKLSKILEVGPHRVLFVWKPRARTMTLSMIPGGYRLSLPVRQTEAAGRQFAVSKIEWMNRHASRRRTIPRETAMIGGRLFELRPHEGRNERNDQEAVVSLKGDVSTAARVIATWAKGELADFHHACEAATGVRAARLGFRDQRSRWGSCSSSGVITLNWRLFMTPDHVRRSVVLHELAHILHPNHGAKFWQQVQEWDPQHEVADRWLKEWGQAILDWHRPTVFDP